MSETLTCAFRSTVDRLKTVFILSSVIVAAGAGLGCQGPVSEAPLQKGLSDTDTQLRPLSQTEALADFDSMIESIHSLYGPLEYKERRFGYQFDQEAARIRGELAQVSTEDDRLSKFYEMLRLLQDGHVSLSSPFRSVKRISIVATPIAGSFYVDMINPNLAAHGIERGDEIISIDGKTPAELTKIILKYSWLGNADSDLHLGYMMFSRPSHIPELQPAGSFALIEAGKPDGSRITARIPWSIANPLTQTHLRPLVNTDAPNQTLSRVDGASIFSATAADLNEHWKSVRSEDASIASMGAVAPFFWSRPLQTAFGVTRVTPDIERAKTYYTAWMMDTMAGEKQQPFTVPELFPDVFAALYRYKDKTVLMLRQPGYVADDDVANLAVYSALIEQYQPIADILIVEQTHNPGGSVWYVDAFTRLFAPNGTNGFVQFNNNDRKWIASLLNWLQSFDPATLLTSTLAQTVRATISGMERDQEAGLRLSREPFAFGPSPFHRPAPITWKKPILLVIDELCGSGGDAFPKLMKANKLATVFGRRTIGMGGSVEPVIELPYSRGKLNLTRGLFTAYRPDGIYSNADMVENNGVQPDISYEHTVDDFRSGYHGYFKAISEAAIGLK